MKSTSWWRNTSAVCLTMILVAAGCSSGNKASEKDPDTEQERKEVITSDPVYGGTLTYGLEAETGAGWCMPSSQLAAGGIQVALAIFEPLFATNEDFEVVPNLAESTELSDDLLTHTIKIRQGVTFHDGSPLNAEIVALNLNILRGDPAAIELTGQRALLTLFVFKDIESVTATDDMTVEIKTKVPWPTLTTFLASGRYGIAGKAQLMSGDGCANNLIGTGPFKFVDWDRNDSLTTERNDDYWRTADNGDKLPYLDSVVFKPIPDTEARFNALEGGTINSGHFNQAFFTEEAEESPDFKVFGESPGHSEVAYGLVNESRAPLNDKDTRFALGQAISREDLAQISNGGMWKLANGPFDTNVMGYLEETGQATYDPEASKAFLEGKNISIRLVYSTDAVTLKLADEVKSQLQRVGVEVEVIEVDQTSLIDTALADDWDVILWRNHPGEDPDTQYVWWESSSPVNFGGINDPEIDRLLAEGRSEPDQEKRTAIYEDLNRQFAKEGHNLWNWYSEWSVITDNSIFNATGTKTASGEDGPGLNWGWHKLHETWIDES